LPRESLARGVFGPGGSKWTRRPNSVCAAESLASEVLAFGATIVELAKLLRLRPRSPE
jgi:hypothetical protein